MTRIGRTSTRARLALVAAATLVALLAAVTTGGSSAAFTAQKSNPGTSFSTAASFCNGSTQTLTSSRDAYVDAGSAATNFGSTTTMQTRVATLLTGVRRSLVGFNLPAIPQFCRLTSATLQLNASTATTGRTINVNRADRAWTESGVTWNTGVAPTGTAVGGASGTGARTWNVTTLVGEQYSGQNNGFILTDSAESALLVTATQTYATKENATVANRPQLTLVFGP